MAILQKTKIFGKIESLLINPNRGDGLESGLVPSVSVDFGGFVGEAHSGLTRKSCSRVLKQYPRGTEIRNVRQISILSLEELKKIAEKMGVSHIKPQWVGANLVLSGIPKLSMLPPSSRLIFSNGVSLVVDMENEPCRYPGEVIDRFFPGKGLRFPKAAMSLRGVTAWVEAVGSLQIGESCVLHIPPQRIYDVDCSFP